MVLNFTSSIYVGAQVLLFGHFEVICSQREKEKNQLWKHSSVCSTLTFSCVEAFFSMAKNHNSLYIFMSLEDEEEEKKLYNTLSEIFFWNFEILILIYNGFS